MSDSLSNSELITDPKRLNCFRVVLGFLQVKNAIGPTIETELQAFQEKLIKKCEKKCQTCKFRIHKGTVEEAADDLCAGCDDWLNSVMKQRTGSSEIYWKNSDLTKWDQPGGHWELAKLFMGSGKKDIKTADATDCSGLLQVLDTCKLFDPEGKKKLQKFTGRLLYNRNEVYHSPKWKVDDDTVTNTLKWMTILLRKVFSPETEAKCKHAINEINELKEMKFPITHDAMCVAVEDIISFLELDEMKENIKTNTEKIEELKQLLDDITKIVVPRLEKREKQNECMQKQLDEIKDEIKAGQDRPTELYACDRFPEVLLEPLKCLDLVGCKMLASHLKLDQFIQAIEIEAKNHGKSPIRLLVDKWWQVKGKKAELAEVKAALEKMERIDVLDALEDAEKEWETASQAPHMVNTSNPAIQDRPTELYAFDRFPEVLLVPLKCLDLVGWEMLASRLKLDQFIKAIEIEAKNHGKSPICLLVDKWWQVKGKKAELTDIKAALEKMERKDILENLEDAEKEWETASQAPHMEDKK